ncbi:MAG: hypothetical protein EpisKO_05050 [Epibacterium sp.]
MRKSRFSEEQIIGILKEHQAGMSAKAQVAKGRERKQKSGPQKAKTSRVPRLVQLNMPARV